MKKNLRFVRALQDKKERYSEKKFIIEGARSVEELLKEPQSAIELFYTAEFTACDRGRKLLDQARKGNVPACLISEKEMVYISDCRTSPGILAVSEIRDHSLPELLSLERPFLLVLVDIQDPGNLGTLIRTAEAAGVQGLIISQDTVDPYNPKVVRSTMGSILRLPIVRTEDIVGILREFKTAGIGSIACAVQGKKYYYEVEWRLPLAIILGSEGAGLPGEILQSAAEVVKIPQNKKVDSLNVAVAGAIMMYQVVEKGRIQIADGR